MTEFVIPVYFVVVDDDAEAARKQLTDWMGDLWESADHPFEAVSVGTLEEITTE